MKFINYLQSISGVDIYPLISLLIFFIFFSALIAYVFMADRQEIREIKQLPLEQPEP